ncbi:LPXTG cell wall anchor domain-containing protein [Microbacterium sp. SORGH_AS_0888]|uniref:LPXTG cell wall anchor domain-containing protein n=1 Tax=Microbacterium sp. SORGH_AS_0888 TaxID=3041791 RepID=UPI002784437E|nr:LPXTG cell wall anchor domain-containing protein [Microbacterium sp. SORGH_AS_0888]MDQ1131182.1 LPXTG-motif cell wall-anchored protein [Microbacterium sp. SORGH_AS_0888]
MTGAAARLRSAALGGLVVILSALPAPARAAEDPPSSAITITVEITRDAPPAVDPCDGGDGADILPATGAEPPVLLAWAALAASGVGAALLVRTRRGRAAAAGRARQGDAASPQRSPAV